jgi:hypothetical protein
MVESSTMTPVSTYASALSIKDNAFMVQRDGGGTIVVPPGGFVRWLHEESSRRNPRSR